MGRVNVNVEAGYVIPVYEILTIACQCHSQQQNCYGKEIYIHLDETALHQLSRGRCGEGVRITMKQSKFYNFSQQ